MRIILLYIIIMLQILFSLKASGQVDNDPPVTPVLKLVTVDYLTGNIEIYWSPSPSPDVSGYVVYLYKDNAGYPLDTLYDPSATSYLRTGSGSAYYSESFVVAALDTAGNISPLSNILSSVFCATRIDTCKKEIQLDWNFYAGNVTEYRILASKNGGSFTETDTVDALTSSYKLTDFETDVQYCFVVRAILKGDSLSHSNNSCLLTKMQHPPDWINADYATINDDKSVALSFTIDPSSEIKSFNLERKTGSAGTFQKIAQFTYSSGLLTFIDSDADITKVNYYRLSAINNCGVPITFSNIASNIVLLLNRNGNEDKIDLTWNSYREWMGNVGEYKLNVNTGNGWEEFSSLLSGDTTLTINYSDLMYQVTGKEVCFMIKAAEASNPYGVMGESYSSQICIPVTENIIVPNIFTPDNNTINDYFKPVLSFTPLAYRLIITDIQRKKVFETNNYLEEWNGTKKGNPLPQGVYLWYLKVSTPSGMSIEKTGTVTIIFNP